MSDRPWKAAERRAAQLIGGARYHANQGGAVDCESSWAVAQVKEVKVLAFPELERLALEAERQGTQRRKVGLVVVKRRAGSGVRTPTLVVMTDRVFRAMSGPLPTDGGLEHQDESRRTAGAADLGTWYLTAYPETRREPVAPLRPSERRG